MSRRSSTIARMELPLGTTEAVDRAALPIGPGHVMRRRDRASLAGWLTSAVMHLGLLLAFSVVLMPRYLLSTHTLLAEFSTETDELAIDDLVAWIDDGALDLATTVEETVSLVREETSAELSFYPVAGAEGNGPGGWRSTYGSERGSAGGRSGPRAEYYGTVAYGDRFVYVLDVSSSMDKISSVSPAEGRRFDRACAELLRSVDRLNEHQWFYVILFCHETRRMLDDASLIPHMVPATAENKARLRAWLDSIAPYGNTDPREALRLSLGMKPSAVFLLSDGEFRCREADQRRGVFEGNPDVGEVVRRSNEAASPIHTFAFEDQGGRQNLLDLAEQTGGEHRDVDVGSAVEQAESRLSTPPLTQAERQERADSLLRLAKRLDEGGRQERAASRYRHIVDEFPGTPAAREAERLLKGDSLFGETASNP